MNSYLRFIFGGIIILALLGGCTNTAETPTAVPPVTIEPTESLTTDTPAPTAVPESAAEENVPPVVEYNLGEATITQAQFPEDSRFRNMPVRLNGLIAAPAVGDGPYPVVVILHGTHPGCPLDQTEVDRWPCAPEEEQPNYQGFAYLLRHLAAQGYVALSININAENTFGFGEPVPGERLVQIIDLHLSALAAASAGGPNDFGVALNGRADPSQLVFIGHSRGGESTVWLANEQGMAAPDALAQWGFGPLDGLLLVAPAVSLFFPEAAPVPLSVVLPACDGDVVMQEGQLFYDVTRLELGQNPWATSVWLEQANHNYFNEILSGDFFMDRERPDCRKLLTADVQQDWLTEYTIAFLTAVFDPTPAALADLGLNVTAAPVTEVAGLPALVTALSPATHRQTLLVPAAAAELTTHLLGGAVTTEGVAAHFCPQGSYTFESMPGSEPCRRTYVTVPGQPNHAVLTWETAGAALRLALPSEHSDLSSFVALSIRAAVDPASPLNAPGSAQAFSVRLVDLAGNSAVLTTAPAEPALRFPPGDMLDLSGPDSDQTFSGRVPLTTIRLPLNGFTGVDLSQIAEVALLFDQTERGTLFVSDLELVRPWP